LSTLVINKYKTVFAYLGVSLFTIIVDKVYAIFGHGVTSAFMTWMFLYPLLGGAGIYYLLQRIAPGIKQYPGYRLFANLYNSGLATFMVGSFMNGIFEIAGTNSPYVSWYYGAGFLFVLAAGAALVVSILRVKHHR